MVPDNRWAMLGFCVTSIGVSAGLIGGVGSIVLSSLNQSIADLKADNKEMHLTLATLLTLNAQVKTYDDKFARLQIDADSKLSKEVFDMSRSALQDRITALVSTDNKAMEETLHQVHDLEAKIVSREENVVHWNSTDALALRMNALSDRMCVK